MSRTVKSFTGEWYRSVDWDQAACQGTDLTSFYPDDAGVAVGTNRVLRKICKGCPILNECADYAITNEQHGFWGGLTPTDRWDIRKKFGIPEPVFEDFIGLDGF